MHLTIIFEIVNGVPFGLKVANYNEKGSNISIIIFRAFFV